MSTLQIECFSLFFAETRVCDMSTDYWSVLVTLDQFGLSFEWMYQSNEFRFIQLRTRGHFKPRKDILATIYGLCTIHDVDVSFI